MKDAIQYHVNGRYVEIPSAYAHLIEMKTRKEIAAEYHISVELLKQRLKQMTHKPSSKKVLPITEVIEIYLELGWPVNSR